MMYFFLPLIFYRTTVIVYIELFNKDKKTVFSEKLRFINNSAETYFEIPENIDSGNYLLAAYTQYQKQFLKNRIFKKTIKIINPDYIYFSADSLSFAIQDKNQYKENKPDIFKIEMNDKYNSRENVTVKIEIPPKFNSDTLNYVLSIARKGTVGYAKINDSFEEIKNAASNSENFIKENRISLSGVFRNKETGEPVRNENVYLAGLKNEKQLHVSKTDSSGRFNFLLYNFCGNKDFYISSENNTDNTEFLIFNSYINSSDIDIDSSKLILPISDKKMIEELFLNYQLSKIKKSDSDFITFKPDTLKSQFGKPDFKIFLKDYIKLPTLHEIFDEIIPSIRVRKENNRFVLSVYDEELNINYNNPLVLLDNIPVFDTKTILKIKPSLINNIEVINKQYLLGNHIFKGIIILHSNSDKFCRIRLPENAKFLKYQGFNQYAYPIFPTYKTIDEKESKIPDFRTTLYWNTGILKSGSSKIFNFYTSDYSADYILNLFIIDKTGKLIKNSKQFFVRKK